MFGRMQGRGGAIDNPWTGINPALRHADAFLFNLETTIGSGGAPKHKEFVFQSSPEPLASLRTLTRPVAGLANNHTMDFGAAGLAGTLSALDSLGLARAGAGKDVEAAFSPAVMAAGGVDIRMLAAGVDNNLDALARKDWPGIAGINEQRLAQQVSAVRGHSSAVVVMLHWGIEYDTAYQLSEQRLAHALVDAGADLVVGSGPHVLRGLERYRGALICYSLGNLVFDDLRDTETSAGALLRMRVTRRADGGVRKRFALAPLRTRMVLEGPRAPSLEDAVAIADLIASRSADSRVFGHLRAYREDGLYWFDLGGELGGRRRR